MNRITKKQRDAYMSYVNQTLEESGSKFRLCVEHPWSRDFLSVRATDNPAGCYIRNYSQSTTSEQYYALEAMYDLLLRLQSEGLLKKVATQ
jgi:hypothetical protein